MAGETDTNILGLTAQVVSAHVANNQLAAEVLPELIQSVYRAWATAGTIKPAPTPPTPAVSIRKSVFPDHIACLEDGLKLKTLKRHLRTSHDMTPDEYRQKWNLPPSYPMVAPNYASFRSGLAKQLSLGQRPANPLTNLTEANQQPEPPTEPPVTRGRARRARGYKG